MQKITLIAVSLAAVVLGASVSFAQNQEGTRQAPMMGQGMMGMQSEDMTGQGGIMATMGMMAQMNEMMETCNRMMQANMADTAKEEERL